MTPEKIVAVARAQVGTPFRHQGRLPGKALDCAGLVVHVAASLGVDYIDRKGYPTLPYGGLLESVLDAQPGLRRILPSTVRPANGDVLLMRFKGDPQHLAICAGETIIHAWAEPGAVAENDFTDLWRRRVVRIYEFVGVER